jgi:hypothetical protein
MKNSTSLMIMLLLSIVMFFINYPKPDILIIRIEIAMLIIGYFIVKQLEENSNNKNNEL